MSLSPVMKRQSKMSQDYKRTRSNRNSTRTRHPTMTLPRAQWPHHDARRRHQTMTSQPWPLILHHWAIAPPVRHIRSPEAGGQQTTTRVSTMRSRSSLACLLRTRRSDKSFKATLALQRCPGWNQSHRANPKRCRTCRASAHLLLRSQPLPKNPRITPIRYYIAFSTRHSECKPRPLSARENTSRRALSHLGLARAGLLRCKAPLDACHDGQKTRRLPRHRRRSCVPTSSRP